MNTNTKLFRQLLMMLLFIVIGADNACAGTNISLRFGDVTTGQKSTSFTVGDFTIYATSANTVTILSGTGTYGDVTFNRWLNLEGGRQSTSRLIGFPVTGNCTIRTYGCSSSSKATRDLIISSGTSPYGTQLKKHIVSHRQTMQLLLRTMYIQERLRIYI
jgi:hypothetical protein